jgi:hypothetical protein
MFEAGLLVPWAECRLAGVRRIAAWVRLRQVTELGAAPLLRASLDLGPDCARQFKPAVVLRCAWVELLTGFLDDPT